MRGRSNRHVKRWLMPFLYSYIICIFIAILLLCLPYSSYRCSNRQYSSTAMKHYSVSLSDILSQLFIDPLKLLEKYSCIRDKWRYSVLTEMNGAWYECMNILLREVYLIFTLNLKEISIGCFGVYLIPTLKSKFFYHYIVFFPIIYTYLILIVYSPCNIYQ